MSAALGGGAYDAGGAYDGGAASPRGGPVQAGPAPVVYVQSDAFSISTEEATYTCTTCGITCGVCVTFGLISNEFPDEFTVEAERAVWVILLVVVVLGSCWTVCVVEPVTGIMQDEHREVGDGQLQEVGACGGSARFVCAVFGVLAFAGTLFGLISNEVDASQGTERALWIVFTSFCALGWLIILGTILNRMFSGSGMSKAGRGLGAPDDMRRSAMA